jgi:hypothetical protein
MSLLKRYFKDTFQLHTCVYEPFSLPILTHGTQRGGRMPRKIELTIPEALAEVDTLSKLVLTTKDHHTRNRHTARRSRLQKYILQQTADKIVTTHEDTIDKLKCQVHVLMGMLGDASVPVDRLTLERLTMDRFYKGYAVDRNEDTQRAWYEEVAMDIPLPTSDAPPLSLESGVVSSGVVSSGGDESDSDSWDELEIKMDVEEIDPDFGRYSRPKSEDSSDLFYVG